MNKTVIHTQKSHAVTGPYSQGVRVGNFVFTSSIMPINPLTGKIVDGDVRAQVKQCIENLKAILEETGSKLENVVKTTIYFKDANDFPLINEAYIKYFPKDHPVRSCVAVATLPKDVSVEIEFVGFVE